MTKEEMAKRIAENNFRTYLEMVNDGSVYDVTSEDECYDSAIEMADWMQKQMIEKACEWLENNVRVNGAFYCFAFKKDDIKKFKQSMEREL